MAGLKLDKGSAIVLEVEFKQHTPFGTDAYFDPTVPKVSVIDKMGVLKVTDADLIKSTVGQYYYVCQTATNWDTGKYQVKVTATSGAYSDVTINTAGFELK